MSELYTFGAASRKQWLFMHSDATIVVYGGSMGGGKTYTGLLKHLKYVDNPFFRGIVIRKSSATIMKSGFIFDEATGLFKAYSGKDVSVGTKAQRFKWKSGAEIVFTHLATDEDAESMRGGQFSFALCDEATELQEDHVLRVLSRLRSKAGIKPQLALTCNPNPDSYLRKWVDWWLIPKGEPHAGRADPKKDGKIRWFLRISNEMIWGDTREELIDLHGDKNLSYDDDLQVKPISFQFISASIYDNPPLIKLNPNYLANLLSLKDIQKERDLYGNWDIRESNAGYFKRHWTPEIPIAPPHTEFTKIVRAWDFAGTLPSDTNRNPDYMASVKLGKLKTGDYVILETSRTRIRFGEWEKHITEHAVADGSRVDIVLPQDPNAQAKANAITLAKTISEKGFHCTVKRSTEGKLESFKPFSACSQLGVVSIVQNCGSDYWNKIENSNEFYFAELEAFTGLRKNTESGHDDLVDATSLAFLYLGSRVNIPSGFHRTIQETDLSVRNPLLNINR